MSDGEAGESSLEGWSPGLTDAELSAAVATAATLPWSRRSRLIVHARQHGEAVAAIAGDSRATTADGYEALRLTVTAHPGRVFVGPAGGGEQQYHFVQEWPRTRAIIVSVRGGYVRTMFVTESLPRWLGRKRELVEVADRV